MTDVSSLLTESEQVHSPAMTVSVDTSSSSPRVVVLASFRRLVGLPSSSLVAPPFFRFTCSFCMPWHKSRKPFASGERLSEAEDTELSMLDVPLSFFLSGGGVTARLLVFSGASVFCASSAAFP